MNLYAFIGTIDFGLVFAITALGVYLTFRVLDFPDLTVDGSFPLGAAIAASYLNHTGGECSSWTPLILSFLGGALAGLITAFLHLKLKILPLLASIITMTLLYSINLRIMDRPNISLMGITTLFQKVETFISPSIPSFFASTFVFAFFCFIILVLLYQFLQTEMGLAMRATGENETLARTQGIHTPLMIYLGLALSNGLVAFSGALYAESQQSADVGMGVGMIVAGLVTVILGEGMMPKRLKTSVFFRLFFVIIGSLIYRLIIGLILNLETHEGFWSIRPSDLNLLTALIVIGLFALKKRRAK